MTNPVYQQKTQPTNYSGVTINITNPTVNAGNSPCTYPQIEPNVQIVERNQNEAYGTNQPQTPYYYNSSESLKSNVERNYVADAQSTENAVQSSASLPNAQPAQYYLNNYNYTGVGPNAESLTKISGSNNNGNLPIENNNMSASTQIINNLNERDAKQKELEENKEKKKIVALTNEYIMSLENYLDNPNTDIRLMASKEVLTRLDEDKDRYDDAALNALLNKMLQDPEKIIRIAALSALSSGLASGNDYTMKLLNDIQSNPNADKEDVLEVSQILLKMSETSEEREVPIKPNNVEAQTNA